MPLWSGSGSVSRKWNVYSTNTDPKHWSFFTIMKFFLCKQVYTNWQKNLLMPMHCALCSLQITLIHINCVKTKNILVLNLERKNKLFFFWGKELFLWVFIHHISNRCCWDYIFFFVFFFSTRVGALSFIFYLKVLSLCHKLFFLITISSEPNVADLR